MAQGGDSHTLWVRIIPGGGNLLVSRSQLFRILTRNLMLRKDRKMFIGIILVAMGVLIILDKMGIICGSFWDYLWPVALIALGADFIFKHSKRRP